MKLQSMYFLALAAMTACGDLPAEAPSREAPPPASVPAETIESRPVSSLAGEWRVAAIDGRSLDEPVGLSLTGDDTRLWWEPRCAGVAYHYRITGETVSFSPLDPPSPDGSPKEVCAVGIHPRLADVTRALDAATRIERTSSNGVLIAGSDHSVTLFAQ